MAENTNSVNEEIIEQAKLVIEEKTFKEKVKYFYHYYRIHVIVAAILLFFIGAVIYTIKSNKEELLQVVVVNGNINVDYDKFYDAYVSQKEFDKKTQAYTIDPHYYIEKDFPSAYEQEMAEKIYIMGTAGEVDVVLCDESYFEVTYDIAFGHDLSLVMSDEQMEKWGDLLFWYDCPDDSYDGIEAVGVDISDFAKIKELNMFPNSKGYFVLVLNSPYAQNALDFLEYLETPSK